MNINDFTQFFENPAVSIFNNSVSKSFPLSIGKFYPAKWNLLSFGNSTKSNSAHSMRLSPLVAPTFANMQFQEHSAIIPLRSIIEDYEEKFNYAKNRDGATLPCWNPTQYRTILLAMCKAGLNPVGSLLDFMGLPVFADLYKSIDFASAYMLDDYQVRYSIFDSFPYSSIIELGRPSTEVSYTYRGFNYNLTSVVPFVFYLASLRYNIPIKNMESYTVEEVDYLMSTFYQNIPGFTFHGQTYLPSMDELIKASSFETLTSALDSYKNYIFGQVLNNYFPLINFDESENFTTLPLRAYWRFHYDWNVNGNFVERDIMLEADVYNFETKIWTAAQGVINNQAYLASVNILSKLLFPVNRLWNDDFFTSLLPTSVVDNAVEIPANSTVLDLAALTAWQKLVMRLSYSSRYRDVIWNVFKIKPSDAALRQSYPIFKKYETIRIGEVNQTSSSDVSGVLGSFAGRGYSSGRTKGYNIFCDEPCVVIDYVSILPLAKYADALHPLVHVDDILDFPIPDMDVLGNQPITADYVSGNPSDNSVVLGYGRQYQEWLLNYGTVHGDFKTTLDYWCLTRRFSDTPVISDDFLRIHPADDLDVIFSVKDAPHAMLDIYYNSRVTRHVHRNVRIKI